MMETRNTAPYPLDSNSQVTPTIRQHTFWGIGLIVAFVFLMVLVTGCDSCKKLARAKTLAAKDSCAHCYYQKEQYESASMYFDELNGMYRGSSRAEHILFMAAMTRYKLGQYITAAHHFREYTQLYPNGAKTEEAAFMVAEAHSKMSPSWELDQTETVKALEQYQLFATLFPESEQIPAVNQRVKELRNKLAFKAFNAADLYYKIYNYKSAIVAYKTMLAEYPDSPWREEAQFRLFDSAALYADNSVEAKRKERYLEAQSYYYKFIDKYPQSKFLRKAEDRYNTVRAYLEAQQDSTTAP